MGLDQYAYFVAREKAIDDTNFKRVIYRSEDYTWRKSIPISRWMFNLFKKKTGIEDRMKFNCQPIRLSKKDIENLQHDINTGKIVEDASFWLPENYKYDDYDRECDLKFCRYALAAIDDGLIPYYEEWW